MVISNSSDSVVSEALSWIGTPYEDGQDRKGLNGGVDCVMLLVRVFVDTGVVPKFDPRPYPRDVYLHRSSTLYLSGVEKYGHRVDIPALGDVALFHYGKAIGHGAIWVGEDVVVHADVRAGKVELANVYSSPKMRRRLQGFWRVTAR